jgi:hypothetical protein
MSVERDATVIDTKTGDTKAISGTEVRNLPTPEEIQQFKARMVEVLDRGSYMQSRFHAAKAGHHCEWVPDVAEEIDRKKALGFDFENVVGDNLNGDGGIRKIGDSVLMSIPDWKYDIIRDERHRKFMAINAPGKVTREEAEFKRNVNRDAEILPTFNESQTHSVKGSDLKL